MKKKEFLGKDYLNLLEFMIVMMKYHKNYLQYKKIYNIIKVNKKIIKLNII